MFKLVVFAIITFPFLTFANSEEELKKLKDECFSINLKIYKIDLTKCNEEVKMKKGINKGQIEKELRECQEGANLKSEKNSKNCL